MPMWSKISFQNSNSPIIEHLEFFHDHSIIIVIIVTISTLYLISRTFKPLLNRFSSEKQEIELFWTSIPGLILFFIAIPSIKILYITDEFQTSNLSIKTTGNQWYWNYEYPEISNSEFEAFNQDLININRSINPSNEIIIPPLIPCRIIISSNDVLHSWTIPSLGVKADATPGRLNQIFLSIKRPGILTGQCSEICGANHRFIPISIISNFLYIKVAEYKALAS